MEEVKLHLLLAGVLVSLTILLFIRDWRTTVIATLAVMATSLSLVVIFLPVAFMGGIVGRFFSSFGMTVAFAIVMSLFVSFTLTPMLCSRFLKLDPSEAGHAKSKSGWIY